MRKSGNSGLLDILKGIAWDRRKLFDSGIMAAVYLTVDSIMETMNIPLPPEFSDELLQKCSDSGDYCPVMFEWYKYVGHLAIHFSCIS